MSLKDSKVTNYKNTNENKEYEQYVLQMSPKSSHFKNLFWAFFIGGLICAFGQLLAEWFLSLGAKRENAFIYASCTLVALAATATGLGVYDLLGRFAGAGSTIPITGFSNAVVAPAIEFKSEGMIYGLGSKMFLVAGPVIVNGVCVSVLIAFLTMGFEALGIGV